MKLKMAPLILLSTAALPGCSGNSSPRAVVPVAASPLTPSPHREETKFPWPENLRRAQDPLCIEAETRVRSGLALAVDVDLAAECVADRIGPEQYDSFKAALAQYYRIGPFLAVPPACLGAKGQPVDVPVAPTSKVLALVSADAEPNKCHETQLDAGSKWRGLCLPGGSKGHFDATMQVLESMGATFSVNARSILADASQDPDVFEWTNMSAHGQTPHKDGMPAPVDGEAELVKWFRGRIQKAATACQNPNETKQALYWTGYALHALEDLAPHRGRTNPEHSYNASHGQNPDAAEDAYRLAVDIVNRALKKLLDGPLSGCKSQFASYRGPQISYTEKLAPPFSLKRDLSARSLVEYKQSAAAFEKVMGEHGAVVRWFGPTGTPAPTCTDDRCIALLERLTRLSDP